LEKEPFTTKMSRQAKKDYIAWLIHGALSNICLDERAHRCLYSLHHHASLFRALSNEALMELTNADDQLTLISCISMYRACVIEPVVECIFVQIMSSGCIRLQERAWSIYCHMWDTIRKVEPMFSPEVNLARQWLNDHLCHRYLSPRLSSWFIMCQDKMERVSVMIRETYPRIDTFHSNKAIIEID
jgi:hypothetical protein